MTPAQFIAKWQHNPLSERAGSQAFFLDLCALLGVPTPADPDNYCFERGAKKAGGGDGWADVWKRGHFGWENKKPGRDLGAALKQLTDYALSLVDGLNGVLGQGAQGLAQGAASLGQQLFEGITGRFGDVASLAGQLSGTLQDTFAALKGPLGTAAKAISTALSGNLLSAFPTIFAAMGTLVTTVGSAFVAMLVISRHCLVVELKRQLCRNDRLKTLLRAW